MKQPSFLPFESRFGAAHYNQHGRARVYIVELKRFVYHARLVWEEANGPVPPSHEVHHKNRCPWDDRLENLECLPRRIHRALHALENKTYVEGVAVKTCKDCKRVLPEEAFLLVGSTTSVNQYRRSDCNECKRSRGRADYRRRRDAMKCVA